MTYAQSVEAAYRLLRAVTAEYPQLALWPTPLVETLRLLWCVDVAHGHSDAEFFRRYGDGAGLICVAGCALQAIGERLAGDDGCGTARPQ